MSESSNEQRPASKTGLYQEILHRFMVFRFGGKLGDMNAILADDVVRFLHETMHRKSPYRDRTPPTHLRNLFRFLFWSGKTKRDLASCLPRVATGRASHLSRSLRPDQIERLLDAAWSPDAVGRRNYAMLMLLARLGLRATEVIAIELDDIDWRAGTILIRGKGKQHDRMPLPEDAGLAIVDYIRNGRRGSPRTLEKHRTYGTGPTYRKLGGRIVYVLDDLKRWADRGVRQSTTDPGVDTISPAKRQLAQSAPRPRTPAPRR